MNDFQPTDVPHVNVEDVDDKPPVCGDCIYCREGPNTQNDIFSRCCYRNPPIPALVQTSKGPAIMSIRPEIRVDTWACGEYDPGEDGSDERGMATD